MEGVLKEMATFYDEMATFQADAMVGVCPVFLQHSTVFQILMSKIIQVKCQPAMPLVILGVLQTM